MSVLTRVSKHVFDGYPHPLEKISVLAQVDLSIDFIIFIIPGKPEGVFWTVASAIKVLRF
jgi:hypothetical protein